MKATVKVHSVEMEERAKRSAVSLGQPVSVTLDPTPTVRLSRSDIDALLERKPRRARRRGFFILGVAVAFVGGAWAGTIKVPAPAPVLPKPAPVVIETVRLVPPSLAPSAPAAPERKLQRLTRIRAKPTAPTPPTVDTRTPLFVGSAN